MERTDHAVTATFEAAADHQAAADVTTLATAADRAERRLEALEAATLAISQELSLERVLQIIVDRVRPLVGARYAALGILDEDDVLQRFITSGISDVERRAIGQEPEGRGLLGVVVREGEAVRVDDISADERSVGFPPQHPPMTSFLGVPVRVEGRAIGRLYLTDKVEDGPFSADDERLVESFARHAGLAIHTAGMHEKLQRLAVLQERERIAQDLHDGAIQSLYAVSLELEDTEDLMRSEPRQAAGRIEHAIESIHGTIGEIRDFITALDGGPIGSPGLVEELGGLVDEFGRSTDIDAFVGEAIDAVVDGDSTRQLIQLTREALSNVARHSGASRVRVALTASGLGLRLTIQDDGCGFDTRTAARSGHHGLANMTARAESLGGSLEVRSDDKGTVVMAEVPVVQGPASTEASR